MQTFKNKNYTQRNYECTNIIACVGEQAPNENWVATDESILDNLASSWTENGVKYYGFL